MSRKFKVWLDSGANIHSRYSQTIDMDDLGMSDEDFDEMTDDQKDEMFKEIAWDRLEWGWEETK